MIRWCTRLERARVGSGTRGGGDVADVVAVQTRGGSAGERGERDERRAERRRRGGEVGVEGEIGKGVVCDGVEGDVREDGGGGGGERDRL